MADLDSNAWYRLSETRVDDNSTGPFVLNLQLRDVGLRVHPLSDGAAAWQFQPIGDVKGRYLMRLDQAGVKQQLGVCFDANEPAAGNTVACLQASSIDLSQQWDVSDFGSGTFKFVNVANGTKYVLDVHPKANLFMSSDIEGSPGVAENQLAQHWVMSSVSAVNDGAYSTIYSANVAVSTKSTTRSSSATSARSATSTTLSTTPTVPEAEIAAVTGATSAATSTGVTSSKGISTAAGAGIGVAVALSVVGLIGAVAFWWWRRSQRPAKPKYSEVEAKNNDGPDRNSSTGVFLSHESAPSSLHGVSPTVGVSSLSSWQPASSVNIPPASSFISGHQNILPANVPQAGYFVNEQQNIPSSNVPQAGYFVTGQQPAVAAGGQGGYFANQQQHIPVIGGQQVGYYDVQQQVVPNEHQPTNFVSGQALGSSVDAQQAASYAAEQRAEAFANAEGPIASLYGQRIRNVNSRPQPTAALYGQRSGASPAGQVSTSSLHGQQVGAANGASGSGVTRHQFDHPTASSEFAPSTSHAAIDAHSTARSGFGLGTSQSQSQTSSTVNLADFEPMPQPHELETAERDIVRRQHELGSFHHGPNFVNERSGTTEQAPKMLATPKAELSAYQHGPDTFANNEAKMLGMPTAELGAYQHGPDTFENGHEAKVLGAFHPASGTEAFAREREDKVLGNLHDVINSTRPSGRGGRQTEVGGSQSFEMGPMRTPAR